MRNPISRASLPRMALPLCLILGGAFPADLAAQSRGSNGWHTYENLSLTHGDNGPSITCMFPGGDSVGVNFRTRRRPQGPLEEREGALPSWPGELTLASGPVSVNLPARMVPWESGGLVTVVARLHVNEPVLAEFRSTGQLTVSALGDRRRPPRAPLDAVAAVLDTCRGS